MGEGIPLAVTISGSFHCANTSSSTDEWIKRMQYISTMEYYSATKKQ